MDGREGLYSSGRGRGEGEGGGGAGGEEGEGEDSKNNVSFLLNNCMHHFVCNDHA